MRLSRKVLQEHTCFASGPIVSSTDPRLRAHSQFPPPPRGRIKRPPNPPKSSTDQVASYQRTWRPLVHLEREATLSQFSSFQEQFIGAYHNLLVSSPETYSSSTSRRLQLDRLPEHYASDWPTLYPSQRVTVNIYANGDSNALVATTGGLVTAVSDRFVQVAIFKSFPSATSFSDHHASLVPGFDEVIWNRMTSAIRALDSNPQKQLKKLERQRVDALMETKGLPSEPSILGTELRDLILPAIKDSSSPDPAPSSPSNSSDLLDNALIRSWALRHARSDVPLRMHGDPDLGLNDSQLRAIARSILSRLSLVQGPPGTGKTKTIVNALYLLKRHFALPHPILVCAPTQAVTDYLLQCTVELDRQDPLKVLRLGHLRDESELITKYWVYNRLKEHPSMKEYDKLILKQTEIQNEYIKLVGRPLVSGEKKRLNARSKSVSKKDSSKSDLGKDLSTPGSEKNSSKSGSEEDSSKSGSEKDSSMSSSEEDPSKSELGKDLPTPGSEEGSSMFGSEEDSSMSSSEEDSSKSGSKKHSSRSGSEKDRKALALIEADQKCYTKAWTLRTTAFRDIVSKADVAFSTCAGAAGPDVELCHFPIVYIDEASQASEPTTLIPLVRGSKMLTLVGDHQQLAHVTISQDAKKKRYSVSMFDRLRRNSMIPSTMLDTQYRMLPQIAEFSNKMFYGGLLESRPSHNSIPSSSYFSNPRVPVSFIHHEALEQNSLTSSKRGGSNISIENKQEAEIVCRIVEDLLLNNPSLTASSIGVVTPYAAQLQTIRDLILHYPFPRLESLQRKLEASSVEVATVDSFQGREKGIIILSTVRSNERSIIGFLKDHRRLNVAMTRAKSALFVVGNIKTLRPPGRRYQSKSSGDFVPYLWERYIYWLQSKMAVMPVEIAEGKSLKLSSNDHSLPANNDTPAQITQKHAVG